ncbi:VAPA (predicted) [Pycnogonum litorale]
MTSKQEQVLNIDPITELRFKGPFTGVVTSYLNLENPSDKAVCFKVKTTAPKQYCVRPNTGILEPKKSISVAVMLQPFKYEPTEKSKHKFMVQTLFAPSGKVDVEKLWKETPPENLMDYKLKCVFDYPMESKENTSPSSDCQDENLSVRPAVDSSSKHSPKANPVEDDNRINDDLKKLKEEISSLRHENVRLKEDGLRQRRTITDSSKHTSSSIAAEYISSNQQMAPAVLLQQPVVMAALFVMFTLGLIIGRIIF